MFYAPYPIVRVVPCPAEHFSKLDIEESTSICCTVEEISPSNVPKGALRGGPSERDASRGWRDMGGTSSNTTDINVCGYAPGVIN
ncbi:hypothetical protein BD311DRAFT_757863 [Dichomitus squalens]|uniref:Uncharacterized protein n=1 Tax=Dichomitus squalens TaxID=114155 RepID=A0A4Q9MM94_9APHY|nr:hypothetical protein BD311DRAFT_757863 [Dichomitus squalens]